MHFYDVAFKRTLKLSVDVKILYTCILDWIKQVYYCRNETFVLVSAELNTWSFRQ